jgi:hypothetical protein
MPVLKDPLTFHNPFTKNRKQPPAVDPYSEIAANFPWDENEWTVEKRQALFEVRGELWRFLLIFTRDLPRK